MQKWQRREDSKGNEWWEVGSAKFGCLDDALLFSAAPDLLTALEAMLDQFEHTYNVSATVPVVLEHARAAIAKAKP